MENMIPEPPSEEQKEINVNANVKKKEEEEEEEECFHFVHMIIYICLNCSANRLFPNSQAFKSPCSDRSILFILGASGGGGRLTREAIKTGSDSRMIPSSMISSMVKARRS